MTKVSYIHGITSDEWSDRSKGVPQKSFVDYSKMTDGQLRLKLINEQLGILAGFYPDIKEYVEGEKQLSDYLHSGVNGRKVGERYLLPFIKKEIARAKWMRKKASAINGSLVPLTDCGQFEHLEEDHYNNITYVRQEPEFSNCLRDNTYKKLLNEHLEESSHHLLYNYIKNVNQDPAIVASKHLNHKLAIENLAKITGLSNTNIQLWVRNGVLRSNVKNGTAAMQPEKTIETLRIGIPYQNQSKVGEPIAATLIALVKVISAIVSAIAAANALLSNMKQSDQMKMQNAASHYGLDGFGPQESDYMNWNTGNGGNNGNNGGNGNNGNNNGAGGNDILSNLTSQENLPFLLGGAAYLLLK